MRLKYFVSLSVVLLAITASSQNATVHLKDGTDMVVRDQNFHASTFQKFRYYLDKKGAQSQKGMKLKEIVNLVQGETTYIPLPITDTDDRLVLFKIFATSADKKLIISMMEPSMNRTYSTYDYKIIDSANKTLSQGKFQDWASIKSHKDDQQAALRNIKTNFSDCPDFIKAVSDYEKSDKNGDISGFFHGEVPYKCN